MAFPEAADQQPVPIPDPTDLDAVAAYAADAFDPGGQNPDLLAVFRRLVGMKTWEPGGRQQAAGTQIDLVQTLAMSRRGFFPIRQPGDN